MYCMYVLDSKNLHSETISRNNLYEISRNFAKCTGVWKSLHNETISRKKVQRNFAEIKVTFVVILYFAKYKSC
jgi:hypothetical protein